jgi:hypothetical protein
VSIITVVSLSGLPSQTGKKCDISQRPCLRQLGGGHKCDSSVEYKNTTAIFYLDSSLLFL